MNKSFDNILAKKLKELPSHTPGDMLWKSIEASLDAEDAINRRLAGLPIHSPSPGTWEAIEAGLPSQNNRAQRRRYIFTAAAVAAAALLLFTVPRLVNTESGTVVESEAVLSEEWNAGGIQNGENEDPMEMIEDLCRTGTPVCQYDLFREKLQLYQELTEELRQLETVINRVGDSPEIIQSVIRIENLKSSTLQEMIQMIHS
jgi:hypothetical protein